MLNLTNCKSAFNMAYNHIAGKLATSEFIGLLKLTLDILL